MLVMGVALTACGSSVEPLSAEDQSHRGLGESGGDLERLWLPGGGAAAGIVGCGLSSGFAYSESIAQEITSGLNPTIQRLYGSENDWYRVTLPAGFCVHHRFVFERADSSASMPSNISCAMYWDTTSALAGTPTRCGIVGGTPRTCDIQFTTYEALPRVVIFALSRSPTNSPAVTYRVRYVGSVPC